MPQILAAGGAQSPGALFSGAASAARSSGASGFLAQLQEFEAGQQSHGGDSRGSATKSANARQKQQTTYAAIPGLPQVTATAPPPAPLTATPWLGQTITVDQPVASQSTESPTPADSASSAARVVANATAAPAPGASSSTEEPASPATAPQARESTAALTAPRLGTDTPNSTIEPAPETPAPGNDPNSSATNSETRTSVTFTAPAQPAASTPQVQTTPISSRPDEPSSMARTSVTFAPVQPRILPAEIPTQADAVNTAAHACQQATAQVVSGDVAAQTDERTPAPAPVSHANTTAPNLAAHQSQPAAAAPIAAQQGGDNSDAFARSFGGETAFEGRLGSSKTDNAAAMPFAAFVAQQAQPAAPPQDAAPAAASTPRAASEPESPAAQPMRDVRVRLESATGERAEIRVQEAAGEVRLSVRADASLSQALRENLPELRTQLERNDVAAQVWRPEAARPAEAGNSAGADAGTGQGGGNSARDENSGQQSGRQQQYQPEWVEHLAQEALRQKQARRKP